MLVLILAAVASAQQVFTIRNGWERTPSHVVHGFFPQNVTIRVGDQVEFVLAMEHSVAFPPQTGGTYPRGGPGELLSFINPPGIACPYPYNGTDYNMTNPTNGPVCYSPVIVYPIGNCPDNFPGPFCPPSAYTVYNGTYFRSSGLPFTSNTTYRVSFTQPGSYYFGDILYLGDEGWITVVAASAPVPFTPVEVFAQGTALIAAANATFAASFATANNAALQDYYGNVGADGSVMPTITAGFGVGPWVFFEFFPKIPYRVRVGDLVRFQLKFGFGLPAPHVVSFMNGNPDIPLGVSLPIAAVPRPLPYPLSLYPQFDVFLVNPALIFPTAEGLGIGGGAFAPVFLRPPLGPTGVFTSGFLSPPDPANPLTRQSYEWRVVGNPRNTSFLCQLHLGMQMNGVLEVVPPYTGPAGPPVYHLSAWSREPEPGNANSTIANPGCNGYNFLFAGIRVKPNVCTFLSESYPFKSWVMLVPVTGPEGSVYNNASAYVNVLRWDLFNALPPCTTGLVAPNVTGVPAPGTLCRVRLGAPCENCMDTVSYLVSPASALAASLALLVLLLAALL